MGILNFLKRWGGTYDTDEIALYEQIVDCYASSGLGEKDGFLRFIPGETHVQDGEKPIKLVTYHLEFDNWKSKISIGALWHLIEETCSNICKFQILRRDRLVSKTEKKLFYIDTMNDPLSVALEEIKYWLSAELSKTNFSDVNECETAKKQIFSRIKYLTKLNQLESISKLETTYQLLEADITIFQLLAEMLHCLTKHFIPTIDMQISRQTSREHLGTLMNNTEKMLKECLRFLFFIYSDTGKLISQFTIQEIRHPRVASYKAAVGKKSGIILNTLLRTNFFMDIFPDTYPISEKNAALISFNKELEVNNFLQLCQGVVTQDDNKKWWQENDSGFLTHFRVQPSVDKFLMAHILLIIQASNYQLFESAYELSGEGGDLMVYGAAANSMKDMINKHRNFLFHLYQNLQAIYETAKDVNLRQIYRNVDENTDWTKNFNYASSSFQDMTTSISNNMKVLAKLQSGLSALSINERVQRAKEKLMSFQTLHQTISTWQEKLLPSSDTLRNVSLHAANASVIENDDILEEDVAIAINITQSQRKKEI